MTRLKTAILGCGQFAHKHAQILLQLSDEVDLVAFCDRHPERAQLYAQQYTDGTAAVYSDHGQMIAQQPLDLLFVCLPPYGHKDEIEQAARQGIHLFVEKPIALEF